MDTLPVINCPDIASAKELLAKAKNFLPSDAWLHLDVTDGKFSTHETWADANAWSAMGLSYQLEVHLMVNEPTEYIAPWLAAGAKRIIVHVESLTEESAQAIITTAAKHEAHVMLSSNPETSIETIEPYGNLFTEHQVLAVHPGSGGQTFMRPMLEKISALREKFPNAIIEVDGGVNLEVAHDVKAAGANAVTSDHYIWTSDDPKKAYEELMRSA